MLEEAGVAGAACAGEVVERVEIEVFCDLRYDSVRPRMSAVIDTVDYVIHTDNIVVRRTGPSSPRPSVQTAGLSVWRWMCHALLWAGDHYSASQCHQWPPPQGHTKSPCFDFGRVAGFIAASALVPQ